MWGLEGEHRMWLAMEMLKHWHAEMVLVLHCSICLVSRWGPMAAILDGDSHLDGGYIHPPRPIITLRIIHPAAAEFSLINQLSRNKFVGLLFLDFRFFIGFWCCLSCSVFGFHLISGIY